MKFHSLAEYWLDEYMDHASGTWEFDRFPRNVFQRSSDFQNFVFFPLHYQLFETDQNKEKTIGILIGLKGDDYADWESRTKNVCIIAVKL